MTKNTRRTKIFIGFMSFLGAASAGYAAMGSHEWHAAYSLALLALASATARMKVKLPGLDGNMSVNMPFLLMAVMNLSAVEAAGIVAISTLVQTWPKRSAKFRLEQMLFNISMQVFATSAASLIWNSGYLRNTPGISEVLLLTAATAMYFFGQTGPVATVIGLSEGANLRPTWFSIVQLSLPYYVLSVGVTCMTNLVSHRAGWPLALAVFPVMYAIYRSYRVYFETSTTAPLAREAAVGR